MVFALLTSVNNSLVVKKEDQVIVNGVKSVLLLYIHVEGGIHQPVLIYVFQRRPVIFPEVFGNEVFSRSDSGGQLYELASCISLDVQATKGDLERYVPIGRIPHPLKNISDFDVTPLHGTKMVCRAKKLKDKSKSARFKGRMILFNSPILQIFS
jgi:hypothetical protein